MKKTFNSDTYFIVLGIVTILGMLYLFMNYFKKENFDSHSDSKIKASNIPDSYSTNSSIKEQKAKELHDAGWTKGIVLPDGKTQFVNMKEEITSFTPWEDHN